MDKEKIIRFKPFLFRVSLFQGLFYMVTGVWPLLSMASFLAVTGPKTDLWLVKTVGTLLIVSGAVFTVAALRKHITFEVALLAVGNALGLAIIEVVYVFNGRISAIYLLDTVVEIGLIIAWVYGWWIRSKESL